MGQRVCLHHVLPDVHMLHKQREAKPGPEKGSMSICWGPNVHHSFLLLPSPIVTSMLGGSGLRVLIICSCSSVGSPAPCSVGSWALRKPKGTQKVFIDHVSQSSLHCRAALLHELIAVQRSAFIQHTDHVHCLDEHIL